MAFDPGLKIGQILKNADVVDTFKCGNMGGMRRSRTTNTLVIVSDYTKGIYHDKWIGGVLHYTGMGKNWTRILIGHKMQHLQRVGVMALMCIYLR